MMVSKRSEKAIQKVINEKQFAIGRVDHSANGNHTIVFESIEGAEIARFTLRSIIAKRGKKRAKK